MKTEPTPVPYPVSETEAYKWGFDVYVPDGTPMAWILDWTSACPGSGVSQERVGELLQFNLDLDLSKVTVDEMFASLSMRLKMQWHGSWRTFEARFGVETSMAIGRETARSHGQAMWKSIQRKFGSPVPLDKIAWYQDITHLLSGPTMRPYSWFDTRKVVCARCACAMRPPKGMESCAKYCRACDDGSIEGYMEAEPELLCVRVPDLGDEALEPRCIHMWTYEKKIVEHLPGDLKERIPDSTRQLLQQKGVRL